MSQRSMLPSLHTSKKKSHKLPQFTNKTFEPLPKNKKLDPLVLTFPERMHLSEPNAKLSGWTFDAKHLDSFLQNHNTPQNNEYFLKKQRLIDQKNQTILSNKSKESCIFRSKPRFDPSPETFPEFFSEVNAMALTPEASVSNIEGFSSLKEKFNELNKKKPLEDKLLKTEEFLCSADQKKKEMLRLKEQRQQYAHWKKELALLTKKRRVMHCGFRSGALNFDNPLIENSYYYQDLPEKALQKEKNKSLHEEKHQVFLENSLKTHQNIEFCNRNAVWKNAKTAEVQSVFSPENKRNIDDFWKSKKKSSLFMERLQASKDRVFGKKEVNDKSFERAVYLRDMETRNKDYNIVSLNQYQVQLKPTDYRREKQERNQIFYFKN